MAVIKPIKVVIVTVGAQNGGLTRGLEQLAKRYQDLVVRHIGPVPVGPLDLALPAAFRLAWFFVNEQDIALRAVHECHHQLSAVCPVTIASFGREVDSQQAQRACKRLAGGVILQSYTTDTLAQVLGLIDGFLSSH